MQTQPRAQMYAFLSRMFADVPDTKIVVELQHDSALLEMVMGEEASWFSSMPLEALEEALNIDFSSLFLMHAMPLESSVLEERDEVLVGLQNPVMQFYFEHGYELNLTQSRLQAPDHLSLECAFMQNLVLKEEINAQRAFLEKHLLMWAPAYLVSMSEAAHTPFYKGVCLLAAEFFVADYESL